MKTWTLLLQALVLLLFSACKDHQQKNPRNVLLITVDTLRADHLGCYGYERDTSPFIDEIAEEGVRFVYSFSPVPITLPSHCSIMTGTYPLHHGVRDNARYQHLDAPNLTLAEILKEKNFQTGAVVSAFVLDKRFGLSQGFDFYDDKVDEPYSLKFRERRESEKAPRGSSDPEERLLTERKKSRFQQSAKKTTTKALDWIGQVEPTKPFFLWLHYFDPHDPYEPPPPYNTLFPPAGRTFLSKFISGYDGEIRYTDEQIRLLFAGMKAKGALEDTLVVFTSDHGEGLGDHFVGRRPIVDHGNNLYTEGLRVPLLFHLPGYLPCGEVVRNRTSLLDIAPTVLDCLGLPLPDGLQGRSLLPLMQGDEGLEDPELFYETLLPEIRKVGIPQEGMQDDRWKCILYGEKKAELFNLSTDPGEKKNLANQPVNEEIVRRCRSKIEQWKKKVRNLKNLKNRVPLDPATKEKLRKLNYLGPDEEDE